MTQYTTSPVDALPTHKGHQGGEDVNNNQHSIPQLVALGAIGSLVLFVLMGYRIGIEAQDRACLPYDVTIEHLVKPKTVSRGDFVLIVLHGEIGHGFDGKPTGKMVAAIPGDQVTIAHDQLYVNGVKLLRPMDSIGALYKKPGDFDRKFTIKPGEILLIGTEPHSFDGRYWGPAKISEIVGTFSPLPFANPTSHELARQTLGSLY